jgi:hypothetical protein|tara:strand:+ start:293 stop:691 length:399 start_codon:yes stop_codon:yes gene_type:complete
VTIGTWEPGSNKNTEVVEHAKLIELLECWRGADPEKLSDAMSDAQVRDNAGLMRLDAASWCNTELLADDELDPLVRFFTLAEMQLSGWDAGVRSPVVYLVKEMKKRGLFTADCRKWIKKNTDNRYLPNGSAL